MTTDGGGWTLVQRTVWDWSESKKLSSSYRLFWYRTVGDATPGSAFRLAGEGWSYLNVAKEHMFVHKGRDSDSGGDCDPLYYLGTDGEFTSSSASMVITPIQADVAMMAGTTFHATDGTNMCPKEPYNAVPWFYTTCCDTCPTFKGSYWSDEAHPMAGYLDSAEDEFGQVAADVCKSGMALGSSGFEGVNQMEYYLR
jgi:hypothetical protein